MSSDLTPYEKQLADAYRLHFQTKYQGKMEIVRINGQLCVISLSSDPNLGFEIRPIGDLIDTSGKRPEQVIIYQESSGQHQITGESDGDKLRDNLSNYLSNPVICILIGLGTAFLAFIFTSLILSNNKPYTEKVTSCRPSSYFLFFPIGESCNTVERRYE